MFHFLTLADGSRLLSRTSRKGPTKMSSPGGRLQEVEVVAHESLDDIGLKFASLANGNCTETYPIFETLQFKSKINFENKYGTSH